MLDSYVIPPLLDEIMAGEKEIEQEVLLDILFVQLLQWNALFFLTVIRKL